MFQGRSVGRRVLRSSDAPKHESNDSETGRSARKRLSLRCKIGAEVVWLLYHQPQIAPEVAQPDGSVLIQTVLNASPWLQRTCRTVENLVRTISDKKHLTTLLEIDKRERSIRLLGLEEQLCKMVEAAVVEAGMAECHGHTSRGLLVSDLAKEPEIRGHIRLMRSGGASNVESVLRSTIGDSDILLLWGDEANPHVTLQTNSFHVRQILQEAIMSDSKIKAILASEGQIPLPCLIEQPMIRKAIQQTGVAGTSESALELLREAAASTPGFELIGKGPRTSMKRTSAEPRTDDDVTNLEFYRNRCSPVSAAKTINAKAVRELRDLLKFYFAPFNMQHNKLIMCLVEGACNSTGLMPSGAMKFDIDHIIALPRLAKLLSNLPPNSRCKIFDLACNDTEVPMPMRFVMPNALELTYTAKFRLIVEMCGAKAAPPERSLLFGKIPSDKCEPPPQRRFINAELQDWFSYQKDPNFWVGALPKNLVKVATYSVSSDLSNGESPKAANALEAISRGMLDAAPLGWESRFRSFVRELRYHQADVYCLQGLQSIGLTGHCSEDDPAWFSCGQEPSTNHLVHFYRELSKNDYGVVFSPTLRLPGSDRICLGNAIFWKRSRWSVRRHAGFDGALLADLVSVDTGWTITVCCSKTLASYAAEWGDRNIVEEELTEPLRKIAGWLAEAGLEAGAVWCGDFGCKPESLEHFLGADALVPGSPVRGALRQGGGSDSSESSNSLEACDSREIHPRTAPPQTISSNAAALNRWRSVYGHAIGNKFWTSASLHTAEQITDYLLYADAGGGGLEPVAVLGGWPGPADQIELLEKGYPSDHVLLLAVFRMPCGDKSRMAARISSMSTCLCSVSAITSSSNSDEMN